MSAPGFSRRAAVRLLSGLLGWAAFGRRVSAQVAEDRGIGGTGVVQPSEGEPDRGIGGTGVVGTIRRFGSIVVNDLRITYDRRTTVTVDDVPSSQRALRLGQTVYVRAVPNPDLLHTRHIAVTSEVVGPIQAVSNGRITVLGQEVSTESLDLARVAWRVGQSVAVYGLRDPDGLILASLIEPRARGSEFHVAGVLETDPDGTARIGNLTVAGDHRGLAGARVVARGRLQAGVFRPRSLETEIATLKRTLAGRLSIEALIEVTQDVATVRTGLTSETVVSAQREDGLYRAIVSAVNREGDGYTVESVEVAERASRSGRGGGLGDRSPHARGPGGMGPGGHMGPGGPGLGGGPGHHGGAPR